MLRGKIAPILVFPWTGRRHDDVIRLRHTRGLGARFEIDARFVDTDPSCVPVEADATRLPTAHFIAARPAEGWIAALALVTVATEPAPAPEWLAGHLARARASFAQWSPEAAELLVPPEAAELAARPAVHVRYRLPGLAPEGGAAAAGPVPPSLVEHWTALVAERRWLLVMELTVQPPGLWDSEREALELI